MDLKDDCFIKELPLKRIKGKKSSDKKRLIKEQLQRGMCWLIEFKQVGMIY